MLDRQNAVAWISAFVQKLCNFGINLLIPLMAIHLHASAPVIGVDVVAASLGPMLLAIPLGGLIDRAGARPVIVLGSFAMAAACALTVLVPSAWLMALWQVGGGLGLSATWMAIQSGVVKSAPPQLRASRIGWVTFSAQAGTLVGPAAAGIVTSRYGIADGFWLMTLAAVVLAVVALGFQDGPADRKPSQPQQKKSGADFQRAWTLGKRPMFQGLLMGSVIRALIIGLRTSFYVVFLHELHFNAAEIGILAAVTSVFATLSAPLMGRLGARFSNMAVTLGALGSMVLGMAGVGLFPGFAYQALCMAIAGVGTGLSQPGLTVMFAGATTIEEQGLVMGLRTTVNRTAKTLVPLMLGVLASSIALPILIPAYSAAGFLGLVYMGRRCKADTAVPATGMRRQA